MTAFLNWLRYHWFNLTLPLSIFVGLALWIQQPSGMALVLWLSLISLLLHQFEEWQYPGNFLQMLNTALFKSDIPDRYPLNANSGMLINVVLGWGCYLLAALFWQQAIWLAIATIMVSIGNIFAHTVIFNLKGKTLYNPGLLTSWLCFAPVTYLFFSTSTEQGHISGTDWVIGVVAGLILNYFGVYKMILWLANRETPYPLAARR